MNRTRDVMGMPPDDIQIKHFPEQAGYKGNVFKYYHVNVGSYAIPVQSETNVGSGGGWHCNERCEML